MRTLLRLSGLLFSLLTFCVAFTIPLVWVGSGMNYISPEISVDAVTAGLLAGTILLAIVSVVCFSLGKDTNG